MTTPCTQALEAAVTADSVRSFLGMAPCVPAVHSGSPAAPGTGRVEDEDVWFTYPGTSQPALAGVGLRIGSGEIVALAAADRAGRLERGRVVDRRGSSPVDAYRREDRGG